MDKKIYRTLANLAKAAETRDDESLKYIAETLTAEGPNELKSLFAQWLEEHGPECACDVPEGGEETMLLDDYDAALLNRLMND